MISRNRLLQQIETAINRSPITALLGPRQCGKTTLAREFSSTCPSVYFDLESTIDLRRLENPELVLEPLGGLVVIDEIQIQPSLFQTLRVLVDRPENMARYLILGSASPDIIKSASESLAGRVEFIELGGFQLSEIDHVNWNSLWVRGGFPRSYLANSEEDSYTWRDGFVRTFLERDIPKLGINIPSRAMRRFWTMLSHYHGQTLNSSELGRAMGVSNHTIQSYLDILTGTYMVRQLQPWFENLKKRQVKSPKIYLRDSGILHNLTSIPDHFTLLGKPKIGSSWEGFVIEQTLLHIQPSQAYFWATHTGAELDLMFFHNGKRFGVEVKFNEAPKITPSMRIAIEDLGLDHLWVVYPGKHSFALDKLITALSILDLHDLPKRFP